MSWFIGSAEISAPQTTTRGACALPTCSLRISQGAPIISSMSSDAITLTFPRSILPELPTLAQGLNERMHELLERNTEGALTETERAELETLAQMAQFAQILAVAAHGAAAA
jgi:hypothetical protein